MARGKPAGLRLETAERGQTEFQQSSLDDLLSLEHRARQVWDYVERLDLGVLYGRVRTTVQSTGRPAIDPAILMSLWLYGTLEGVGSARLLDRLCKSDAAYRWLCGGVSVNYHTLSDFRSEAGPVLDDLLSRSMVGLIASGLVDVQTVAVDGLRVRASAGSGSFRSGERLAELMRRRRKRSGSFGPRSKRIPARPNGAPRHVGRRWRRIGCGGSTRQFRRTPKPKIDATKPTVSSGARSRGTTSRCELRPATRKRGS